MQDEMNNLNGNEIAIIGMAGRFPMAKDLTEFWRNLRDGVEVISHFSEEELLASGVSAALLQNPHYVRAKGFLEDADLFDAVFFGYSPGEAALIDPQQRLFLECSWQALEDAGYDALTYDGLIGVYAGLNMSVYYEYVLRALLQNPDLRETIDPFLLLQGNEKDYLTTRVSYKLNLRGPSIVVQTACSTSLVAVHLACQSLLNGECDMALAGGVSLHDLQKSGYMYQKDGIASPDGHCRTFDADAQGTLSGSGLGLVVLKRLAEALDDGDTIRAVIKGTACNNDGASKVGYTAPSVQGQTMVIAEAQSMAGTAPETISLIEAHGTATALGDPIEVTALNQAFRARTNLRSFCAIGSVKTNMGHLGAAAGIAGLLKTVLALEHKMLPPSLHFHKPNPQVDFASSPFYVNNTLAPWPRGEFPRRAGVSSFGIGGTNAHVVLEEAPDERAETNSAHSWHLLIWSAKTSTALQQARANLADYLRQRPDLLLADVAHTLQVGRSGFTQRQCLVCQDLADAVQALTTCDLTRLLSGKAETTDRPVAFLFPGQGAQHVAMGQELYQHDQVFRAEIDQCAELLLPHLQLDIRSVLYPQTDMVADAEKQLTQTWLTQPALFVLEYALARRWEAWGIRPQAMIGHSIGEYVAACLAGVFSLESALRLVAVRGRLMQRMASGAMLALPYSRSESEQLLTTLPPEAGRQISIAAINAPAQVVVSGPEEAIQALEQHLQILGKNARRLKTSHAFHSTMAEPILADFRAQVSALSLQPPQLRFLSNLTGTWITTEQATDPDYWVQHLRREVRFADGIATLLQTADFVLLEVGPGRSLSAFAKQQTQQGAIPFTVSSLPHSKENISDDKFIMQSLGHLWLAGVKVAWAQLYAQERRRHIPLPTYPFERQSYLIKPRTSHRSAAEQPALPYKQGEPSDTPAIQKASEEEAAAGATHSRPFLANAYVAPNNALEQKIAAIWSTLLGIDQIGIYDNFFDLGGHSLLATQIVARLRAQLQMDISLRSVLEKPTIAELALAIEQGEHEQVGSTAPGIAPLEQSNQAEATKTYPLSFAQQRLWFFEQLEPGTGIYNMSLTMQISGTLSVRALEQCLHEVVRRHESLRTTFVVQTDQPAQVVQQAVRPELPVLDLRTLATDRRLVEARSLAQKATRKTFDLTSGPLFRATLLHVSKEKHILLLGMHHIISDGWSQRVLTRELVTLYEAFSQGKPSPLPPLLLQYGDFAVWQRNWLQGETLQAHLDYWKNQLRGAVPVDLPVDRPHPDSRSYTGAAFSFHLPSHLSAELLALSRQQEATLFMTLLAAFQVLLYRYSGQTDIVVGTDIANRTYMETEALIGFFVNLLALRTDVSGSPAFQNVLRQVRQTVLKAYTHQNLPFDTLIEHLKVERQSDQIPLIRVLFVLQNIPHIAQKQASIQFDPVPDGARTARFDLALFCQERAGKIGGEIIYSTDIFDARTIENLFKRFEVLLQSIVNRPDASIDILDITTGADKIERTKEKQIKALHSLKTAKGKEII